MADVEKVKQGLRCCKHLDCQEECPYFTDCNELQDSMFTGIAHDALSVIEGLQAEIEQLNRFVNGFSRDAMPVVRCKDCKHYDSETQSCLDGLDGIFQPDWFCADGERKDGDGDV